MATVPALSQSLDNLHLTFVRLRARWLRQGRLVRRLRQELGPSASPTGRAPREASKGARTALYNTAWSRWSATSDELADLVDAILRQPALALTDLAVKFDALSWLLLSDGSVLDHAAERQVRAFGRQLRRLADRIP